MKIVDNINVKALLLNIPLIIHVILFVCWSASILFPILLIYLYLGAIAIVVIINIESMNNALKIIINIIISLGLNIYIIYLLYSNCDQSPCFIS